SRWKGLHPDSWVLAEDSKLSPHYTTRAAAAVCPLPPTAASLPTQPDRRLKPDTLVVGFAEGDHPMAYPLTDRAGRYPARAQAVEVAGLGERLVIFSDPAAHAAVVYRPEAKQQHLTFASRQAAGVPSWRDRQTGSMWNL